MADWLLIIAQSGRMLAQAAVQAGFRPLVIDLFGDCDTRTLATHCRTARSLAWSDLKRHVAFFSTHYPVQHLVYGSGFESHLSSLKQLNRCFTVWGNSPAVFATLNNKAVFFSALSDWHIPYPKTRFSKPTQTGTWLAKPQRGQGGLGIKPAGCQIDTPEAYYWQQYQPGVSHSVLFLADGVRARIVGFNRQWTTRLQGDQAFVFSGISNRAAITPPLQAVLTDWVTRCTAGFSLRGLNSLDFILYANQAFVLEINPRIPASMQLYGADLLRQHMAASQGNLPACPHTNRAAGYCAYEIVYAPRNLRIPDNFRWPKGCADLPPGGATCRQGQPLCSIIARHPSPGVVLQHLADTRRGLFNQLTR